LGGPFALQRFSDKNQCTIKNTLATTPIDMTCKRIIMFPEKYGYVIWQHFENKHKKLYMKLLKYIPQHQAVLHMPMILILRLWQLLIDH
jgi:hypothetical protein